MILVATPGGAVLRGEEGWRQFYALWQDAFPDTGASGRPPGGGGVMECVKLCTTFHDHRKTVELHANAIALWTGPEALDRIQLGGVRGETLDDQPTRASDEFRAVLVKELGHRAPGGGR